MSRPRRPVAAPAPVEPGERRARRLHAVLLALAAAGAAVWLWRLHGFEPLRIVDPPAERGR